LIFLVFIFSRNPQVVCKILHSGKLQVSSFSQITKIKHNPIAVQPSNKRLRSLPIWTHRHSSVQTPYHHFTKPMLWNESKIRNAFRCFTKVHPLQQ